MKRLDTINDWRTVTIKSPLPQTPPPPPSLSHSFVLDGEKNKKTKEEEEEEDKRYHIQIQHPGIHNNTKIKSATSLYPWQYGKKSAISLRQSQSSVSKAQTGKQDTVLYPILTVPQPVSIDLEHVSHHGSIDLEHKSQHISIYLEHLSQHISIYLKYLTQHNYFSLPKTSDTK